MSTTYEIQPSKSGEAVQASLEPVLKEAVVSALEPQAHEVSVAPLESPPEGDSGAQLQPFGPAWSMTDNQDCQVWNYGEAELEPFTWSGSCIDGKVPARVAWPSSTVITFTKEQ